MARIPVLLLPAALLAAGLPAGQAPGTDFLALGRELVALVEQRFYDSGAAEAWAKSNIDYGAAIGEQHGFRRETRRRLAVLGASHTEYYTPADPGYRDLLSIFEPVLHRPAAGESLGLAAVELEGGWFAARIFAGGPAEAAGLRRGDRLLAADGEPFHPVRSLAGRAGRSVILEVQSIRQGPSRPVAIVPRTIDPKQEWQEAQAAGTRLVERRSRRIGYVPVWSCAGVEVRELLLEALAKPLADADALVLDLRGGWGGCNPELVGLFDPAVPDLASIDREGRRAVHKSAWRKPLVVLIDGGSRSGKEVVARALQRHRRAVLVGERTAGAVLAGQPFLLSDGSLLFLAVEDVLVDGERLEGSGVAPDIAVAPDLPYAEGRDPQLERALAAAADLVRDR
jgi:carboxyl-terminal processing protease